MPVFNARDIIAFPGGDNSSDTVIGNVHFNKTSLDFWNYTLYSNGTISNGSWCFLTFEPYIPSLVLDNGTFVNATWCYTPVNKIGTRAGIGIGFAVLFAAGLGLTLVTLRKHGRLYLPAEKRFYPIGRRWQWYWAIFSCAAALISLFTNIDVDRYYLPELPIVLTSFFWYLMQMGAMAIVWEAVRHWGSWMERQFIDPDPFSLSQDDRRGMIEFWMPLVFYFWLWINFFIVIPRNWGDIEHQRYPEQIVSDAIPTATDARFKTGPFCLVVCWLIIVFSLRHSIQHYCPRNRGLINRAIGFIRFMPARFYFLLPLALVVPAFQALVAWEFAYSPLNVKGLNASIYAGGYLPTLLIVFVQIVWGFITPNEDLELKRQRRIRGDDIDRQLNIHRKPAWWQRVRDAADGGVVGNESMRERIARNVREVGGGKPTARNLEARRAAAQEAGSVEMGPVSPTERPLSKQAVDLLSVTPGDFASARATAMRLDGLSERTRSDRVMQHAAGLLFPNSGGDPAAAARRREELMMDGPPPYVERGRSTTAERPTGLGRGTSTESAGGNSINSPPQQVRSMLDV
ncbi:hypothetical protein QBC47DRAFT_386970 [Echria macrotheca]|uniref:Uncharacterized protein n=1 Tax=Echria macrotheca TaxID=438768 RepID=A0AAJ0F7U7_9PEZI|nr:hypothetical protein QBC47DRAFT_386970 [Echria macrotheca]